MRILLLIVVCSHSMAAVAAVAAEDQAPQRPQWLVPTLHSGGVLLVTRLSCSFLWPEAYNIRRTERNWTSFKTAWSSAPALDADRDPFEWDGDPWSINLVGHGLMGSEFYLRHRQGHHRWWSALAMTVAWTVAWEYGIESWHKQPSAVDLAWSPLGGALIGEGRFQLVRLVQTMEASWARHLLLYLIDPLGQMERDLFDLHY